MISRTDWYIGLLVFVFMFGLFLHCEYFVTPEPAPKMNRDYSCKGDTVMLRNREIKVVGKKGVILYKQGPVYYVRFEINGTPFIRTFYKDEVKPLEDE